MRLGKKHQQFKEKLEQSAKQNSSNSTSTSTAGEFDIHSLREAIDITFNDFLKDVSCKFNEVSVEHMLIKRNSNERVIKAAIFTPCDKAKDDKLPAIIFNPAGGLAVDMAHHQHHICSKMAESGNAIVICIQPQLSPEIKLPTIFSDAYYATNYFYQNANHYGIDMDNFVISGYSMGGTIALDITLKAITSGDFKVAAQVIISGVTRLHMLPEDKGEDFMFDPSTHRRFVEMCLAKDEDLKSIADNPLYNPTIHPSVKDLPPTYFIAGECDIFRADSEAMHDAIKKLGGESTLTINSGHIHNTTLLYPLMSDGEDPAVQAGSVCQ